MRVSAADSIATEPLTLPQAPAQPAAAKRVIPKTTARHAIIFDIETGPQPENILRGLYVEPTYEEFAANCDARWKEETKREKFEINKVTGWQKFVDGAALDPITGRILAIGYHFTKEGTLAVDVHDDMTEGEADLLRDFWDYASSNADDTKLIGHNINSFDLPFLVRRSWLLKVPVPAGIIESGRYFNASFVDTMRIWACGGMGGASFVGLNTLAQAFGVGGKSGDGAQFAATLETNRQQAIEYVENDLLLTYGVAKRMGLCG